MEKAIYKITNNINGKSYIGQSIDPDRRFREHVYGHSNSGTSLIHRAITKYGENNFTFEILGWFEDYNEKEKYFITLYDSQCPNGYNILEGGEEPPVLKGEDNPTSTLTQETVDKVIEQMLDWKIPRKNIIKENNISDDQFRHINEGHCWRKEELSYPLRPEENVLNIHRAKYIQWLCCTSDIPLNKLGAVVGWGRSSAKMINWGNNHHDDRLKYPIRDHREYNKEILNQETCIDYLRNGE